MNSTISSVRWKLHTEGKEPLEEGLQIGLREYEIGLPYINDSSPEKLRALRQAVKQNSESYSKIKNILFPDGNPAVVAAQEVLDVIKLSVRGEDAGYIAETVFQSDEETVKPLFNLLGLNGKNGETATTDKSYSSKPKVTWNYRS